MLYTDQTTVALSAMGNDTPHEGDGQDPSDAMVMATCAFELERPVVTLSANRLG